MKGPVQHSFKGLSVRAPVPVVRFVFLCISVPISSQALCWGDPVGKTLLLLHLWLTSHGGISFSFPHPVIILLSLILPAQVSLLFVSSAAIAIYVQIDR